MTENLIDIAPLRRLVSLRDYWQTPDKNFQEICLNFSVHPYVDACASQENTKCMYFIDEQQDALKTDWFKFALERRVPPIFWMNPPYTSGLIDLFLAKALHEATENRCVIVGLIPPSLDLKWWHRYVKAPRKAGLLEMEEIEGRIHFIPPPGIKSTTPRRGNVSILYGRENITKSLILPDYWPYKEAS